VDSRDVTKEIRHVVWPELREHGFEAFTGRTAWRYVRDAVDVVNVQSFGASIADAVGCTTFSFSVNLGVWLPHDALTRAPKRDPKGRLRPSEYQCEPHRRRRLTKSLSQPWFRPFSGTTRGWLPSLRLHREGLKKVMRRDVHDRPEIWFVLSDGSNLNECMLDAVRAIREDALPWFELTRTGRAASF
jgi:Domain of unknown function (DUF4304)